VPWTADESASLAEAERSKGGMCFGAHEMGKASSSSTSGRERLSNEGGSCGALCAVLPFAKGNVSSNIVLSSRSICPSLVEEMAPHCHVMK
jgi:hypothetical protein